jgi:ribose transport system ATP-binding protein
MSLLTVSNVAKSYGPVVALRAADLAIEPGEIHALLGANGAGKSTLVKILTGVIAPDSGEITVGGSVVTMGSPRRARAAGLAPVFQDPALMPDLTVAQNMRLTGADLGRVQERLRGMEVTVDPDELVGDLPLATLRMIDLARALSFDP